MGLFLKSKPQVVVSIQPSFVVPLGRCYPETVDGAKHNSSLFVFLIPPHSKTI